MRMLNHVVFLPVKEIKESTLQVLKTIHENSFLHHVEKLKTPSLFLHC